MIDATDNHKQIANEVLDSIPITHKAKPLKIQGLLYASSTVYFSIRTLSSER